MNLVLLVLLLALGWVAITGSVTAPNLLLGGIIAGFTVFLLRRSYARPPVLRRIWQSLGLAMLFLRELLASAIRVAAVVISPRLKDKVRPAIVDFPLSVTSDVEIALLANLITLTPGTLTIDVSADRQILKVHVLTLSSPDHVIRDIADGFERRIKEIFA